MSIHYVLAAHANNCNCGWHINEMWISGWLLCENSDNYNKLDAKGRGSIDKCQSKNVSVAGEVSLGHMQSVTLAFQIFQ